MLKIIGAGQGRTGTMSLKVALEQLGYDKCYHMETLVENPEHLPYWEQALHTTDIEWDKIFDGYQAGVDYPVARYYKELMEIYPEAKIILTVRSADSWYKSVRATIYKMSTHPILKLITRVGSLFSEEIRQIKRWRDYVDDLIWSGQFENRIEDEAFTVKLFNEWNEEVKRSVPADKLLVFEVKDGWEPVCDFLGVDVPDTPFPRVNSSAEFQHNITSRIPIARFIF